MHQFQFSSSIGWITITGSEKAILKVQYGKHGKSRSHALLRQCATEIMEYLSGTRQTFTVPLQTSGTHFHKAVLQALRKIPYGITVTYSAIAREIGSPRAYRAVGNACKKNALPLLIPCHRIVGIHGIGGYSGGIKKKAALLAIEAGSA